MNTSPITTWEGAEAYYTFGPNSFGVWFIFIAAVALFIGFIAYTVRHENHSFADSVAKYPELKRKVEASRISAPEEKPGLAYMSVPQVQSKIESV
ncbi:hypothetical protein [Paenibacillus alkalitolerans]|uniref:hypothetical protein n=1 Tax=Paenibacillus alkalitolerans TaxID=2799335 RepID=UPI0018F73869|nr:hypothetical protein [Paenibacillus alkalitolerans]